MRLLRGKTLCLLLACALLLAAAPAALGEPCGADRCATFQVPGSAIGAAVAGPDGNLWFAAAGYVGRLSPRGALTQFAAPSTSSSDIAAGPSGSVHFTARGIVGSLTTTGLLDSLALGSRTLPGVLAVLADGTLRVGAGTRVGTIGADGETAWRQLPSGRSTNGAGSMAAAPDGNVWFTESHSAGIGRLGPDGSLYEFNLPDIFGDELGGVTIGPDGGIWFTAVDAKVIGRLNPNSGRTIAFETSFTPTAIVSGPSHSLWFAMSDSGRQRVVRMSTAGFKSYFAIGGTVRSLAIGPDQAIWIAKDGEFERLAPFVGAYPIRNRVLGVSRSQSVTIRLFCPLLDYVFCAGRIRLLYRGQAVGTARFAQRVNDAPSTRIHLTRYGTRVMRAHRRLRVIAVLDQHDQGGSSRTSSYAFTLRR